ncbi:hypothetical protein D9M68_260150 [compost metagenome]
MKYACMLLCLLVLAGCKSLDERTLDTEYSGADAGYVVIGLGESAGTEYEKVSLFYKRSLLNSGNLEEYSRFDYPPGWQPLAKPDYRSDKDEGVVLTAKLAPGEYEFVNFNATIFRANPNLYGAYRPLIYSAPEPFSITFMVSPGVTTYLGNYQAVASEGQGPTGFMREGPPIFLLEDRVERDLAMARKRVPGLFKTVENASPKAAWIKREYFVDEIPPEILSKQRGRMSLQEILWGG